MIVGVRKKFWRLDDSDFDSEFPFKLKKKQILCIQIKNSQDTLNNFTSIPFQRHVECPRKFTAEVPRSLADRLRDSKRRK